MTDITATRPPASRATVLGLLLAVAVLGGSLSGIFAKPDDWYQALAKPWFAPPHSALASVWLVNYITIAIIGSRIWRRKTSRKRPVLLVAWALQLLLNWLWAPVFLVLHLPEFAFIIAISSCVIIAFMAVVLRRRDAWGARLLMFNLTWLGFVSLITFQIATMNH